MINSVRDTVHDFLEKNNRGWLRPERFNNYAYLAQMEIFESYFYDYARWIQNQNNRLVGSGFANIPKNLREKLNIFHKYEDNLSYSTDRFTAPSDSYRVLDIFYDGEYIDEVSQRRLVLLSKSSKAAPSTDYPVYVREEDDFVIYPLSITSNVSCDYIRKPATPKWTYLTVNGNPVFNPSAGDYQDFEIHPSDEPRLVVKILGFAGISIREQDVVAYAEREDSKNKLNQNRQ